jgi:hypothetical protein
LQVASLPTSVGYGKFPGFENIVGLVSYPWLAIAMEIIIDLVDVSYYTKVSSISPPVSASSILAVFSTVGDKASKRIPKFASASNMNP